MKVLWGLGKVLSLMFLGVALFNLFAPLINPFDVLINLAASLLLLTHAVELLLFKGLLQGRLHPWRDRLLILLVGIFHAYTLGSTSERDPRDA